MTQKLLCLCAAVALLIAFSTANVASAQNGAPMPEPSAPVACPCEYAPVAVPCRTGCYRRIGCYRAPWFAPGCPPVVTYRVGLFGHLRPVVHAPVYRPVPVFYHAPVVYRPAYVPRLAVGYPCATPYVFPARAVYAPYCW
jgi:hypothetical protein